MRSVRVRDAPEDRDAQDGESLFSEAYRELAPAVRGYLRSRGVPDPEAVAHDVFMALYPRIGTVRGGRAGLKTLVFTIAHARTVDHYRERARTPAMAAYHPDSEPRSAPSAEDVVLGRGTGILGLIEELSPDQREVIALRVIADLSLEQTAAITQRSTGAVKQLQRRALLALRNRLDSEEEATP
ncbi:RNA polymerase sigma factor [Sinomonas soli]